MKKPRQVRSQQTLDRLLDAAEELIAQKGFENTSVADIAKKAKSSVGAFYSRFHDKDGLLTGLQERFIEEAVATAEAVLDPKRWEGASTPEIVREAMAFLVRTVRERQGLLVAFSLRAAHDATFARRNMFMGLHIAERLRDLLLSRREEIRHPNSDLAIRFGYGVILGSLQQQAIIFNAAAPLDPISDEQAAGEYARLYLSYLGIEEAAQEKVSEGAPQRVRPA
ncbi:MAG: helix-turn-helix domain-containing protein [Bdellovibrionota bacterium]